MIVCPWLKRHFTSWVFGFFCVPVIKLWTVTFRQTKLAIKIVWAQELVPDVCFDFSQKKKKKFSRISSLSSRRPPSKKALLRFSKRGDNRSWHMIKDVFVLSSNFPSPGWKPGRQDSKQGSQIVWRVETRERPPGRGTFALLADGSVGSVSSELEPFSHTAQFSASSVLCHCQIKCRTVFFLFSVLAMSQMRIFIPLKYVWVKCGAKAGGWLNK